FATSSVPATWQRGGGLLVCWARSEWPGTSVPSPAEGPGFPSHAERRPVVTPITLNKATSSLLTLAVEAIDPLGPAGLLILPEGSMDWPAIRELAGPEAKVLIASSLKNRPAIQEAG